MQPVDELLRGLARDLGVDAAVMRATAGMLAVLAAGTAVRATMWAMGRLDDARQRMRSLATWWVIVGLLVASLWAGGAGVTALMATVSVLALREWLGVVRPPAVGATAIITAFALAAAHYACIAVGRIDLALAVSPMAGPVLMLAAMMLSGRVEGFIHGCGAMTLGLALTVYLPSLAAVMAVAPFGGVGWVALLMVLTLVDDIAAALVGRAVGGPHILPTISPKKTWSGFVGAGVVTAALAALFAPSLTGSGLGRSIAAGVVVWLGGFFGDAAMSAVKRDRGIGPSGDALPGQGGILDRIDSLTFTAPLLLLFAYGTH